MMIPAAEDFVGLHLNRRLRSQVIHDLDAVIVEFRVVMTPDDLQKAGLNEVGKKWA
jgi:hypothetical protein